MNWDIITYSLVALTLTAAAVALILAKLEVRDKRNKFFGFRPRDLKTYAAYISFVSTILIIFFQTELILIECVMTILCHLKLLSLVL